MTISLATLQLFWRRASANPPLIVFGAGRWGRLWADVVTAARGGSETITVVARSNFSETIAWMGAEESRRGLRIVESADEALGLLSPEARLYSGLIASRPRDHLRDIDFCVANGLPALVEKPFTDNASRGAAVLARARKRGVALAIGTEFAFLPSLHFLLAQLGADPVQAEIVWEDPEAEQRHGAVKRSHDEISVLEDILPHAMSILREIVPEPRRLKVSRASLAGHGGEGWIEFEAGGFGARLQASQRARSRKRLVTLVDTLGRRHVLDFSGRDALLTCDALPVDIPQPYRELQSTLRLELGAWQSVLAYGDSAATQISQVEAYLQAHDDLMAVLG